MHSYLKFCVALLTMPLGMSVAPATAQSSSAITTDGIADIRIGMSRHQVARFLKPGSGRNGCWESRSGLTVLIERGAVMLVQTSSSRLSTPSGARVGMSERALRRIYPSGLELTFPDSPYRNLYYYSGNGNGIQFSINDGKITEISAGKRDALHRDEYCA